MAKQITSADAGPNLFKRIQEFFDDIIGELKKVTWPSRDDLMASTKVTLFLLLVMAAIIFIYDRFFGFIVMMILNYAS